MKLSEAIRNADGLYTQAFGYFFTGDRCCSLGAAMCIKQNLDPVGMVRAYGRLNQANMNLAMKLFPELETVVEFRTSTGLHSGRLITAVMELNDVERKSFDEIAQWLEERGF